MNHNGTEDTKTRKGREVNNVRKRAQSKKNLDVAAPLWLARPFLI